MADTRAVRASDPVMPKLGEVACVALPPMARCVFRGMAGAQRLLAQAFECERPDTLRAVRKGEIALLWQGPDEILVLSSQHDPNALIGTIEAALGSEPHACVDVSDRQIGFMLSGQMAATLLSTAVMVDLDVREFPPNMVTRTVFAKADLILWRTAPDQFHVEVWRSYVSYVLGVLAEGSRGLLNHQT